MSITAETRRESYENLDNATIKKHIKRILADKELTAREIAKIMYNQHLIPHPVRQAVAPRLTELEAEGIVEAIDKAYDSETKRNVAVYQLVKQ